MSEKLIFRYVFSPDERIEYPVQVYVKGYIEISRFCDALVRTCGQEYQAWSNCKMVMVNPRQTLYRCLPGMIFFDVNPGQGASPCTVADIKPGEPV